jgi:hypothetical protein
MVDAMVSPAGRSGQLAGNPLPLGTGSVVTTSCKEATPQLGATLANKVTIVKII